MCEGARKYTLTHTYTCTHAHTHTQVPLKWLSPKEDLVEEWVYPPLTILQPSLQQTIQFKAETEAAKTSTSSLMREDSKGHVDGEGLVITCVAYSL